MRRGITSFRVRIFLLTALIVTLVLAAVAGLSWRSIVSYQMEGLNQRLCSEVRRLVFQPHQGATLEPLEEDLKRKLRLQSTTQLLLWLQESGAGGDTKSLRKSAHWPEPLNPDQVTWERPVGPDWTPAPAPHGRPQPPREGFEPANSGPPGAPPNVACAFASFTANSADWRAARIHTPEVNGLVAADLGAIGQELYGGLQRLARVALPLALLLTGLGALALSAMAIQPLGRLRRTMETVHEKVLSQRLPIEKEDREFRDLISAYNKMLERLEASFHQASRFSADAAHELKTPLTILQGQLEHAISLSSNQPFQLQLVKMLDEVARLSAITRKLLLLSQADAGILPLTMTPVDLASLLNERLADAQLLDLKNISISSEVPENLVVQADAQMLGQALNNLCSNAFKYTQPGGWINVLARQSPLGIEIFISNSTSAIMANARARFFDRFFRGDEAHNRSVDGYGLGLSLSRAIVRGHDGDLTLEPSHANEVRVRLWLPIRSAH